MALTSRLLERPMSLAFVAEAAAGKNATVEAARVLVPTDAVYVFRAGSPRAFLYSEQDLQYRIVLFTDADAMPHNTAAASAVRALAEGQALRYELTTLNPHTGHFETRMITKPGPTGLITTSTGPLRPPLNTRLLRVAVADDEDATREVMLLQGRDAAGDAPPPPDLRPFLAFQRWLSDVGVRRVLVPFGEALADAMPDPSEVRTRRDFPQLLSAVRTIALLHQRHRDPGPGGAIVATFEDYQRARDLLCDSFYFAAAEDLTPTVLETLGSIGPEETLSIADWARRLHVTRQTMWARLRKPLKNKWIVNLGPGRGRPTLLQRGRPVPARPLALPETAEVEGRFWGIPAPPSTVLLEESALYWHFAALIAAGWPEGITAAEAAEQTKRDPLVVRARLDALVAAKYLDHDPTTDRYRIPEWVRGHPAWRRDLVEALSKRREPASP